MTPAVQLMMLGWDDPEVSPTITFDTKAEYDTWYMENFGDGRRSQDPP
jgi:hypothetical protein